MATYAGFQIMEILEYGMIKDVDSNGNIVTKKGARIRLKDLPEDAFWVSTDSIVIE